MATGDQSDFIGRLRAALPGRWFAPSPNTATSATPILDAVLAGFASTWASLYTMYGYVSAQARIATAFGVLLDMISADFFGVGLPRLSNETDAVFRARIRANLFASNVTRAAILARLLALTGKQAAIFEPSYAADTGSWGAAGSTAWGGLAYGYAGGYGSYALPAQLFVIAHRPAIAGIPSVAGYGSAIGGYGNGGSNTYVSPTIEYGSVLGATGAWTDSLIYAAVANAEAAGVTAWVQIQN